MAAVTSVERVVMYAEHWGVEVLWDKTDFFSLGSSFTYKGPVAVAHRLGVPHFPYVDLASGAIYYPRDSRDPFGLIHELAHMIATDVPPPRADEDGDLAAFEYASVRYLQEYDASISPDRWAKWRASTGPESAADALGSGQQGMKRLVRRRLFDAKGQPRFREWKPPRFVAAMRRRIEIWNASSG